MNYYQHHIGDFNNATRHLSLIERAIYRDLLDMYYDTEKAIDASSIDRLARRLQCTTEEQKEALKYVLDEFFILEEGVYRNNRCEREIAEYHGKKKQASEAGKASAAKRAAKKKGSSNSDSSKDDQASNENSTVVENPLNEEQTDVQPTNNHKPLTINQEPIIDSSSNAREENSQFTPIQFAQYQIDDHKRYSMREFISEYSEFQYDFRLGLAAPVYATKLGNSQKYLWVILLQLTRRFATFSFQLLKRLLSIGGLKLRFMKPIKRWISIMVGNIERQSFAGLWRNQQQL